MILGKGKCTGEEGSTFTHNTHTTHTHHTPHTTHHTHITHHSHTHTHTHTHTQEHAELQEKYACLQDTTTEQEMALVELGKQLSAYVFVWMWPPLDGHVMRG